MHVNSAYEQCRFVLLHSILFLLNLMKFLSSEKLHFRTYPTLAPHYRYGSKHSLFVRGDRLEKKTVEYLTVNYGIFKCVSVAIKFKLFNQMDNLFITRVWNNWLGREWPSLKFMFQWLPILVANWKHIIAKTGTDAVCGWENVEMLHLRCVEMFEQTNYVVREFMKKGLWRNFRKCLPAGWQVAMKFI